MNLADIAKTLGLESITPELSVDTSHDVTEGYVSDLLSDVLAHAPRGGLLITVQVHMNVVAVSLHSDLAGVIFALGRRPEESVRARAVAEGIPLFVSSQSAFELAGQLYALGLRGPHA